MRKAHRKWRGDQMVEMMDEVIVVKERLPIMASVSVVATDETTSCMI